MYLGCGCSIQGCLCRLSNAAFSWLI